MEVKRSFFFLIVLCEGLSRSFLGAYEETKPISLKQIAHAARAMVHAILDLTKFA